VNCRKVSHLLSAYMDGELPGVEHRQIHEHLAQCSDCAQEYRGLLQMKRLLAGMRIREAQTDLPIRILQQVHVQDSVSRDNVGRSWLESVMHLLTSQNPRPQVMAIAASFAIVGIVYASYAIDRSEQIVWHAATPAEIARLQPAPPDPYVTPLAPAVLGAQVGSTILSTQPSNEVMPFTNGPRPSRRPTDMLDPSGWPDMRVFRNP
jgi:hypothetical protein